jgi:hypothetical protein
MSEFKKIPIPGQVFILMFSVPAAPGTYALFQLSGYIRDNNISNSHYGRRPPEGGTPTGRKISHSGVGVPALAGL